MPIERPNSNVRRLLISEGRMGWCSRRKDVVDAVLVGVVGVLSPTTIFMMRSEKFEIAVVPSLCRSPLGPVPLVWSAVFTR